MSSLIDRRGFIKKGSLFIPGILTSTSLLGFFHGCSPAQILFSTKILGGLSAAVVILEYLGIRPSFSKDINYVESSQCKPHFQKDEEYMRQHGMKLFVGIRRSLFDTDIAIMVGTQAVNQKSSGLASVQFKNNASVNFNEKELDALRAAAAFVKQHYNFSNRDLAQAIAITGRREINVLDEVAGNTVAVTRFLDARGGYTIYNPHPMGQLARFTGGTVSVYQPGHSDPNNPPIIGLEA